MGEQVDNPNRWVAKAAARQHGIVTQAQLVEAGIGTSTISRWAGAGRLHRIHRGVYAVGHPRLSFQGRCLAAVLACGKGAVASHRAAAAIWGMLRLPRGRDGGAVQGVGWIEVTVPSSSGRARRAGLVLHRSTRLAPGDITRRHGIPVTTPSRTLHDLRRTAPPALVRRAARRALDLRLVPASSLGSDPDLTRSELERRFLALCSRHRLPRPQVNSRIGPYEVDFLWPDRRLIVETDGFRHHGHRAAFESDRARDAALTAQGYRVLRFTYRQVSETPHSVIASLRELL